MAGSYEALFSKQLYKSMGLKDKNLDEADYKKHLRTLYFLSRPVFVIDNKIYIGTHNKICCK
jgi:arsenate reductase